MKSSVHWPSDCGRIRRMRLLPTVWEALRLGLRSLYRNGGGPIVLLAPPLTVIPCTRLIPSFLRWPFAPLLDHRRLTSDVRFSLPELDGCAIKTIAGRFDFSVPLSCTRHPEVDDATVLIHTHNSMLFASEVARFCLDWIDQHVSSSDSAGVLVGTNQSS